MPQFTYIARRADGSVQRGSLQAATAEQARETLRKQGLTVEELQQRQVTPQQLQEQPANRQAAASQTPQPQQKQPPKPQPPHPPQPASTVRWQQPKTAPVAPPTAIRAPVADFIPVPQPSVAAAVPEPEGGYVPIGDTLRLFAGWLIAWYAVVYLLGSYQAQNKLPFDVPFVDSMFTSPLILRFAFGTYLFLFFGTLHRWLAGGIFKGLLLCVLWVITFAFFHVNV
jgi:hypothetical protein